MSITATTDEIAAIVKYLGEIDPGCRFMENNYDTRRKARVAENKTLANSITTLQGTPIFQAAVTAAQNEALGDCLDPCTASKSSADCKSCLDGVDKQAWCLNHPD